MRAVTRLRLLWKALALRDEYARYLLAEKTTRLLYPSYVFSEFGRTFLDDTGFRRVYESVEGSANLRSLDRKYALDQLVQLSLLVPGDTAECGVFRGVSSLLICRRIRGTGKTHHLFDSFEGLSQPRTEDGEYWTRGDLAIDEATVRRTLREFDFVSYHKGWIPERFQDVADSSFAFVHVDVDLHQPTLESLRFFYERLSPGGMLLCDDYGFRSCPGATKAVDDFMETRPEPIVRLPTGQAFVMRAGNPPADVGSTTT